MKVWRIGLIGFGNVGQGFVKLLHRKRVFLERRYGFKFKLVAISDPVRGNAYSDDGLDLRRIIELVDSKGSIKEYGGYVDFDSIELAKNFDLDIVVEVTPTNVKNGEPGLTHIRVALDSGKHVVTSNKGPIALAFWELMELAKRRGVYLGYEGTVMSGTPALDLGFSGLAGCEVTEVLGILNGTTNYILSRMEDGMSYEEALREAQRRGYAEADPTMDVDGWDAAIKAVIIANTLMGGRIRLTDVKRQGISGISSVDIENALEEGARIKLIAHIVRRGERDFLVEVKPMKLPLSDPLANVMGVMNAITFVTDSLGSVTLVGPGAGRIETGQALLMDILHIHKYVTLE